MEFAQVRYFLALCEELSFTRAAKRCGVSQPSLTNGIKNLECHFGGKLFYRIASPQSPTRPTELAIALEPHLKRMNDSANLARKTAEQFFAKQNNRGHQCGSSLTIETNPGCPGTPS
jgi:DNA-binding transcriptional LysR family regulator